MALKRTAIGLVSAAVVVSAGLLLWSHIAPGEQPARTGQPDIESDRSASRLASADEVSDIRRDFDGLRGQVGALQAAAEARARQQLDADAASKGPTEESADKRNRKAGPYGHLPPAHVDQAIADDFHAALIAQPVDREWSKKTTLLVRETVRDTGNAQVVDAECRSSLCRVEMIHQNRSERESELDKLVANPPWNTDGFMQMIESNPPRSVVYFTRSGYQLPKPPNAD